MRAGETATEAVGTHPTGMHPSTKYGFVCRFLYKNLLTFEPGSTDSLFVRMSGSSKLSVKDSVSFHLYISTAPCGDGALFSVRSIKSSR